MVTPCSKEAEESLKKLLGQNFILIVDAISSARTNLAATLVKLGAVREQMALVGTMDEAREVITKEKPKLIFSDFMIGSESGLDLIQTQKSQSQDEGLKDTVFVLVTSNASQSTVARAAEEDVDTFVIKPYTINSLKNALGRAVDMKVNPSRYLQLIEQGKDQLFLAEFDAAVAYFTEAMEEQEQPTLACFYYGQAEMMKSALTSAYTKFDEGLSYNKIHYKCLVGLFDLLSLQKKYLEAYEVVKRITQYFPANPSRLGSALRLAIITENFQDMEGYYRIYLKIEGRSEELIKYMCSALVVTGKYYLRNKVKSRALQVFENAALCAGPKTAILLYAVETLVEYKLKDDSARFSTKIEAIAPESPHFWASRFLVSTLAGSLLDSVQLGRDAIQRGCAIPSVYEKLIFQSMRAGHVEAAERLFFEASSKWPEQRLKFLAARECFGAPAI